LIEPIVLDIHKIRKIDDIRIVKNNLDIRRTSVFDMKSSLISFNDSKQINLPNINQYLSRIKYSRLEYSRNLKNMAFPNSISYEKRQQVKDLLCNSVKETKNLIEGSFLNFENCDYKKILSNNFISENKDELMDKAGMKYGNLIL
jgi:hypothetical protein